MASLSYSLLFELNCLEPVRDLSCNIFLSSPGSITVGTLKLLKSPKPYGNFDKGIRGLFRIEASGGNVGALGALGSIGGQLLDVALSVASFGFFLTGASFKDNLFFPTKNQYSCVTSSSY